MAGKKLSKRMGRTVSKVIDGDTFMVKRKVNGSNFIRLNKVNTPEKGMKGYSQAKKALSRAIGGKKVSITPKGKSYSRVVGKVTQNRKNISKFMGRYSR